MFAHVWDEFLETAGELPSWYIPSTGTVATEVCMDGILGLPACSISEMSSELLEPNFL